MASRARAFIATPLAARARAFVVGSVARARAFVAAVPGAPPADYTVTFAADCGEVTVRVARNWTAEAGLVARVLTTEGAALPAVTLALTPTEAVVRFAPPRDGHYVLLVNATSGPLYRAPVPVYCRALHCLRELTRAVATGGRLGQPQAPGEAWRQVYGRLRLGIAAAQTNDAATADALLVSIAPYCADCACPDCDPC